MKNLLIALVIAATAYACNNGNATVNAGNEIISFYSVPLVCGAALEIGCGSRAKPVLLEMEKNPAIKEAWLNRTGTEYAIVWKEKDETETVAKPLFEKYEIEFTLLKNVHSSLASFRRDGKWYRGGDVDKLSIEEAATIADKYVAFSMENDLITEQQAEKIKPHIENYFKAELVKIRTKQELFDDSDNKFRTDVGNIFTRQLGEEKARELSEKYSEFIKEEYKRSCCTKGAKSCCDSDEASLHGEVLLKSTITCPHCGYAKVETMPTDVCQLAYTCRKCKKELRPKAGDCCVYCTYGSVKCPSMQEI